MCFLLYELFNEETRYSAFDPLFTDLTRAARVKYLPEGPKLSTSRRRNPAATPREADCKTSTVTRRKPEKHIYCCRPLLRVRTRGRENNGRPPIPQAPPTPSRDDRARQRPRKGDVGRRMPRHRREAARARRAGRGDEARQNVSGGEDLRRVQKADGPDGRLGRPGAPVLFRRVRVVPRPNQGVSPRWRRGGRTVATPSERERDTVVRHTGQRRGWSQTDGSAGEAPPPPREPIGRFRRTASMAWAPEI